MKSIIEQLEDYSFEAIEDKMEFELNGVVEKESKGAYCAKNLKFCVSCIDYTTLKATDTQESVIVFIDDLLKKIKKGGLPNVASVCTYPNFVATAKKCLTGIEIRTTVVSGGFPSAQTFPEIKMSECKMAASEGADEIDVVIGIGDIIEKNYDKVYKELQMIRSVTKGKCLKVILETGELKSIENIFNAAVISMLAGADFIKTSTGKVPMNATLESAYIMCHAINQYHKQTSRKVGLKVSGGITKAQMALRYLVLASHVLGEAWITPNYFRIGTSQLLDDILKEVKELENREK